MQDTDFLPAISYQDEQSHRLRALLGGAAGLFMESLLYPIDTMRTRMKANTQELVTLRSQMKSMYRQEGPLSFYRGYTCLLAGCFLGNAAYFYIFEKLKQTFNSRKTFSKEIGPFVAAFTAGFAANMLVLPYIVVKTRMQLQPGHYEYKQFFDGARQIIKHEGFPKLYLGGPVFFTQAALELGLTFGFYEIFYKALEPVFPKKKDFNLPLSIVSSMAASVTSSVIIQPLDVIVTRLQATNTQIHGSLSAAGMIKMIYKNEGYTGFIKGATGTISLSGMSALILIPTYELLKSTFNVDLPE